MQLRKYQREMIDASMQSFRAGNNFTLIQAPTGSGKTVYASGLFKECIAEWNIRCLFLCNIGALILQTYEKLLRICPELDGKVGIYSAGVQAKKEQKQVTIGTIQSMRPEDMDSYNLVIVDEVHNLPFKNEDSMFGRLLLAMIDRNPRCRVLGLTATPYRLAGGYLYGNEPRHWFDSLAYERTIDDMIAEGYLSKFRYKVTVGAKAKRLKKDLTGLGRSGGEYNNRELTEVMTKSFHLESAKKAVDDHAKDRRSIVVFCCSIAHAEKMAEVFDGVCVHSKMSKDQQRENLEAFTSGAVRVMANMGMLTTGFDHPPIDCIVMARPTLSPALLVQCCGRGLRLHDGKKDCLILDMGGNYDRHGLFTDPKIKVEGDEKKKKEAVDRLKICPECGELFEEKPKECEFCGFDFAEADQVEWLQEQQKMREIELAKPKKAELLGIRAYSTKTRNNEDRVRVDFQVSVNGAVECVSNWYKVGTKQSAAIMSRILQKNYGFRGWCRNKEQFLEVIQKWKPRNGHVLLKAKGNYWRVQGW